jgi:hypothetical protein
MCVDNDVVNMLYYHNEKKEKNPIITKFEKHS